MNVNFCSILDPGTPSPPKAVSMEAASTSIQLEAPSERGCGGITDYIVRDNSTSNTLTSSYSVINGNVTIIITGLEPGRQYAVVVSAINNRSWEGPSSQPVSFRTDEGEITNN